MSDFNLEVGGLCANGAEVLAVCKDTTSGEGVVLADWGSEFVTWGFHLSAQESTAHGNYFRHDGLTHRVAAYADARADFVARVNKLFNKEA